MTKHVAFSIEYNGLIDLFNACGSGERELSLCGLSRLAYLTPNLNKLLLELRKGLRVKLYANKGEESTVLFNLSRRQSRLLEHKEMGRQHNGDSMFTLTRLSSELSDKRGSKRDVKVNWLTLADIDNDLRPGFSYDIETCDDFDRFVYDLKATAEPARILKHQLAEFISQHPDEDAEFIIVTSNPKMMEHLIKLHRHQVPSNIKLTVMNYSWHQLINEKLEHGVSLLYDLDTTIRIINIVLKQFESLRATSPTADFKRLDAAKAKVASVIQKLGEHYPLTRTLRKPTNYSPAELKQLKNDIADIATAYVTPMSKLDCEQLSFSALTTVASIQGEKALEKAVTHTV